MKMIILAAGEGKRLRPLTSKVPKCLVEVGGRSILDWQIGVAHACGIREIVVVRGYKREMVARDGLFYFDNLEYATTNMVESLWKAEPVFEDGFIVSYADIIFEAGVLKALMCSRNPINVVVDMGWKEYWEKRFENVLSDAETLAFDEQGRIANIGRKPQSIDEINGQYIGLMSFLDDGVRMVRETYRKLLFSATHSSESVSKRRFENLFMTDFLQAIIDTGYPVMPVAVRRGWLEIDSPRDIEIADRSIVLRNEELRIH